MAVKKAPAMRPTGTPVAEFLARVPDQRRREDARRLCALMQEITGEPPAMWATSIVGFGSYHYRYASGREGDSALASFSPRSQHLAITWSASSPSGISLRWPGSARTRQGRAACT